MKIRVIVDQKTALREGIDAPTSACLIDIDPAELTEEEREVLASLLASNHDTTASTLQAAYGQYRHLEVVSQDLGGLRRGLADLIAWRDQVQAECIEKRREADDRIDAAIANPPPPRRQLVRLSGGGVIDAYSEDETTMALELPSAPAPGYLPHASEEAQERLSAARRAVDLEEARLREAARPELERLVAARDEKRRLAEEAKQAEYNAVYQRLPVILRERHRAGYASPGEVRLAFQQQVLADTGQELDPWCTAENASSGELAWLSNDEFLALQRARAAAPPGATVTPALIWLSERRPATEAELDDDLADEDDEIEERIDERRVFLVRWTVGGVPITAVVPM